MVSINPEMSRDICSWLVNVKLSRIVIMVLAILIFTPLITHFYLSKVERSSYTMIEHGAHSHQDLPEDLNLMKEVDLRVGVEELFKIRGSVLSELRDIERKRQQYKSEIQTSLRQLEELKQELSHHQMNLNRLKISVEQAQVAQREAVQQNTPDLAPPLRLTADSLPVILPSIPRNLSSHCRMFSCFDHSRCSLTSGFPVYLYDPDRYPVVNDGWDVDGFLKTTLKQTLGYNPHLTNDPKEACVYLVLAGEALKDTDDDGDELGRQLNLPPLDSDSLRKLPYWGGDGRNHVLLNLARRDLTAVSGDIFSSVDTGRAILVQSTFNYSHFRPGFDLIISPVLGPPGGDVWQECIHMLPARRKYLLTFQGEMKTTRSFSTSPTRRVAYSEDSKAELDRFVIEHLKQLERTETSDRFLFEFECNPASDNNINTGLYDWALCGTDSSRRAVLKESTYVLIFAPGSADLISTTLLQARIYEALRSGAIPVILGGDQVKLSYDEVIQWRRAAIFLPRTRVTELHFLIRAIPDEDVLLFRRQGRLIWERYLASVQSTLDTIVAVLRDRLNIPALPTETVASISVFNETFQPILVAQTDKDMEAGESLGPLEPPFDSPSFRRNYSLALTQGSELWNDWGDPFRLYPALPFDPLLPSDAKFIGSGRGFRPIGQGQGGAGKEFSEALGGNNPREQFTVLLLTYEREQVLLDSIARLKGLPYLNSVVVVWNSPRPPSADLRWPDIGLPVEVVKAARNSLNNRFLPLDNIRTEAVLSVDDDAHLRHDEILFGFRVWREHRDRIVGFPGRYHAWDLNTKNSWLYNSNYSCELSMVLTGAAFLHRHYLHLYWKLLPQAIRDKVDEYMNCEDIAMNFLVSHVTRKPPVKVTSRWTFRCPGCPQSLSEDDTHFQERHKCINFFTQVFGYMPLLNTQYRADSILFKTRIAHDKQKCFKFI